MASEVGVYDVDPEKVILKVRLKTQNTLKKIFPIVMLCVDWKENWAVRIGIVRFLASRFIPFITLEQSFMILDIYWPFMFQSRLKPGRMLLVDTLEKKLVQDAELKMEIARSRPHSEWLQDKVKTTNPFSFLHKYYN